MLFGIKTSPQDTSWDDMLAVWTAADDIDVFHSAWNFDHFYPIYSDSNGPCLEGWVTLTALAQATRRIRIGCMVNGIVYRHPAVLANMASALDIVSRGRLDLGLGAGWNEEECEAYGIELGSLTDRFDRIEEALEIVTRMLADEHTTFEGRFFQVREARNEPKGPQQPLPVVIGGGGEKRLLPLVARYAHHWNFNGFDIPEWSRKREVLHGLCREIERDPSEIMTSIHVRMAPDQDPKEVAEQAAAFGEVGMDLVIVYLSPPHTPAVLEPLADALAAL